ncbi:hypothetical protein KUTeg_013167 [Tegillarca granosa]|uniref:Cadherin domain-containing protein n=1 Tax=Tegillarca granosa TaxID=220873 RepID=A0ABQ9EYD3_TEGGR|nr:hypothetical protein KUTeg_013167 [Tegillarca granosa]
MSPLDTVVGQLQATDPDNGQTITYKLTDDSNGRFKVVGDEVNSFGEHCEAKGRHFCALDYESVKSYDIVVKATDSGDVPLSVEFTLTIDIEDSNDVPTDLNMVANSIPENTPVGQTVATFTVSK